MECWSLKRSLTGKKVEGPDVAPVKVKGKAIGQKIMVMKGREQSTIHTWSHKSVAQPNLPPNKVITRCICDSF